MVAMKSVNVHDAKTHFSSLLARVEQKSECIVICRNGEPVANLVPHKPLKKQIDIALSNSFGFGGTNASLIFRKVH